MEDDLFRVLATAPRSKPVRARFEPGFPLGFQRVADPALMTAIRYHGNPEWAQPRTVACLRYVHPPHGHGLPGVDLGVDPSRHLHPGRRGESYLPVDTRRPAAGVALRGLPHADQRVAPAPQQQLL